MVKMRFIFLGSVLLHGLLALSIGQYVTNSKKSSVNNFSVVWINSNHNPHDLMKISINESASSFQKNDYKKNKKPMIAREKSSLMHSQTEIVHSPSPIYPTQAKREGIEGFFLVKMIVNENGDVESMQINTLQGRKEVFEETIFSSLKEWKFKPGNKKMSFEIPISFQLDS